MKLTHGWIILCTILIFSACGKSTDALTGGAGSCSTTDTGTTFCTDYTGSAYTSAVVQASCTSTPPATSTYSGSACTSTGRIGSCTVNSGQPTEMILRFFPAHDSTTAPAACSGMSGTYTAG